MGKTFQSNFVTKATRVHIVLHFMIRVEISSKSTYLCMALSYGTWLQFVYFSIYTLNIKNPFGKNGFDT
jgi:hypothetical protein